MSDAGDNLAYCDTAAGYCNANPGDTVTLSALPFAGYSLLAWSGGTCVPATNPATCTLTVTPAELGGSETDNATFALAVPGTGSTAVYVSPLGNDGNPGTQGQPVATPRAPTAAPST